MADPIFDTPKCFLTQKRKTHIKLHIIRNEKLSAWLKKQDTSVRKGAAENGFDKEESILLITRNKNGSIKNITIRMDKEIRLYDMAQVANRITTLFSSNFLKSTSFEIQSEKLSQNNLGNAHIGWALGCYEFTKYKKSKKENPALLWAKGIDKKRANAYIQSVCMLRSLINTPANDMGPEELEKAARKLATTHKATIKVVKGKELETGFPMVFAVGDSSPRRPRLIDIKWGKAKDPKLTIIGKGVCFDTGGLDLKPSAYMRLMKKDMGGAAHALGVAKLVMGLNLPVRLRVLIPAVENSVSGKAFRPGDIFTSRKGLTIENTNTDAEGRLILTDALTLASEEKPDLIIDFCTLTGSARAALGQDIPAFFSNNEKLGKALQDISMKSEDPLWEMPLWQPYRRHNESAIADLHNSAGIPGDLIYSALFLESFLVGKPNWMHMDVFAWESSGRPGRPKGGCDTGMRAVFALLEKRYGR
ncbi:MAG: leucyl aminopeptidase [Micavibrio sp.]|nr:MAG: leucyl aminopeptidase [Micavibrio sp.]